MPRIFQERLNAQSNNTYLWLDGFLRWIPSADAFERLFNTPVPIPYDPSTKPKGTYQYEVSPNLPYPTPSLSYPSLGAPGLHVVPFTHGFPPIAIGTPLPDDVKLIRVSQEGFGALYYLYDCGQWTPGNDSYRPISADMIQQLGFALPQQDTVPNPVTNGNLGEPISDLRLTTKRLFIDEYRNTYLWLDGTLRWIPSREVLQALVGGSDPWSRAQPFRYGYPPLPLGRQLSGQTRIVRQEGTPELYLVDDLGAGPIKRFLSASAGGTVFFALQFDHAQISDLSAADFAKLTTGSPLDTRVDPYPGWGPLRPFEDSQNYCACSFAMVHDSHTAKDFEFKANIGERVDQNMPVLFQLVAGARAIRISSGAYPPLGFGAVILQHGNPLGFGGPLSVMGLLADFLQDVAAFLTANPSEIITIIDEGDPDNYPGNPSDFVKLVASIYEQQFGQALFNRDNAFPISQLQAGNFPTIGYLRSGGQRVVVFAPHYASIAQGIENQPYPWILPCYQDNSASLIGMTQWDGDLIENPSDPPAPLPDSYFISKRWPASGHPPLYLVNHYYVKTLPLRTESDQEYAKWGVGDLVTSDSIRAWSLHQRPNFINCDFFQGNVNDITQATPTPFFQGVADAKSHLIDLVNAMNQASSPAEVETFLANSSSH